MRKKGKQRESSGYAYILLAAVALTILVVVVVSAVRFYRGLAYGMAAQHDLSEFVAAQQRNFSELGRYVGNEGDFIEGGDTLVSTFPPSFDFVPSQGVRILIVSGNGAHPDRDPSFKAKATHEKARKEFVYDFVKHTMEESRIQP